MSDCRISVPLLLRVLRVNVYQYILVVLNVSTNSSKKTKTIHSCFTQISEHPTCKKRHTHQPNSLIGKRVSIRQNSSKATNMTNMMMAQRIKRVGEERRQEKAVRVEVAEAGLGAYTRQSILVSRKRKRKRTRSQNLERNRQMKKCQEGFESSLLGVQP